MTVALFICVVPEGLPVVLTLSLVNGVYRMAQQGVLIKRMQAVEGLGRTDVIVIDKTGTLTRNEMMVTRVVTDEHDLEVEQKTCSCDVFNIKGQFLGPFAAIAKGCLAQASQAGTGQQPLTLFLCIASVVEDRQWARSDDAHLTAHDIEELGQFIDAVAAQENTETRQSFGIR